ncbi:MAG: carboxypeptidase-like regulatory domain-containing protein, partial [Lentisphaeria bacterium]
MGSPDAYVIGTVTDKKGQAFAGALIQAKGRGGPGTRNNTYATTSEDGSFELGKLKPGNYVIKAECGNGRTLVVVRHLSPGRHRVQFRGQRAPSFSGRVVDSAGRAVANASLEAIELGAPSKHGVSTVADKDGRYQLTVPTDGVTYAVAAEAAVSNTQDGWHIHFLEKKVNGPGTKLDITLPDTVRINGKIILPDALRSRIENSGVLAIKSMRYASSLSYPGVKTSNDYSFVLDLVPGRYNLFFVGALLQEKGKKPKHPMVPLGVFDVPDEEAEVVYEKNLTKSMFQEAWTLKEFRRRIKEARMVREVEVVAAASARRPVGDADERRTVDVVADRLVG